MVTAERSSVERTLVKSPPELWEVIDDGGLMARWATRLADAELSYLRVAERSPGERLTWEGFGPAGESVRIGVTIAERGWGTSVAITVERDGAPAVGEVGGVLEALLDELGSNSRRPFGRAT